MYIFNCSLTDVVCIYFALSLTRIEVISQTRNTIEVSVSVCACRDGSSRISGWEHRQRALDGTSRRWANYNPGRARVTASPTSERECQKDVAATWKRYQPREDYYRGCDPRLSMPITSADLLERSRARSLAGPRWADASVVHWLLYTFRSTLTRCTYTYSVSPSLSPLSNICIE